MITHGGDLLLYDAMADYWNVLYRAETVLVCYTQFLFATVNYSKTVRNWQVSSIHNLL